MERSLKPHPLHPGKISQSRPFPHPATGFVLHLDRLAKATFSGPSTSPIFGCCSQPVGGYR